MNKLFIAIVLIFFGEGNQTNVNEQSINSSIDFYEKICNIHHINDSFTQYNGSTENSTDSRAHPAG